MDRFSKKERSVLMSKIKTSGTDIEEYLLKCVKQFWTKEHYRKNLKSLPGRPDIVFTKSKIAIFADGDFWHGKDFENWKRKVSPFWKKKITSNLVRDLEQTAELKKRGYKVLRFWGSSIKKNPKIITKKISRLIK